jgi:hypothetical protein
MSFNTATLSKEKLVLQLLECAYYGTGGFEYATDDSTRGLQLAGSTNGTIGSYLVRHEREPDKKYLGRQAIAYYLNYLQPVVDSHVTPLFRREITRTGKASQQKMWDAFFANADGGGRGLAETMQRAAFPAKRDGVHVLVMTAPKDAPKTAVDAIEKTPFIYGVAALDIVSLERDRFGRIQVLQHAEIVTFAGEQVQGVRELRADGWRLMYGENVIEEGTFERAHKNAPVVEIAPGFSVRGTMLPRSEFVAVARCCHRLFNLCSELDEIIRSQTFSILVYPAKDVTGLTIGPTNVLGFDPEYRGAVPAWIAPPDGPAAVLQDQFDRLVREIYRMALLTHQTGSTNKSQTQTLGSGIALRIDRENLDSALADYAKCLEQAEREVADLWSWITGESIEYDVAYPRDFTLQDMATELQPLLDAWTTLGATAPVALKAGIMTRVGALILEDDEDALEELEGEMEKWKVDAANVPPPGGQNPSSQNPPPEGQNPSAAVGTKGGQQAGDKTQEGAEG